ncbi:MAG TPA: hypothetical protein VJU16_08155, partial [Planctomycetota bacterium]|nr:hypothetical protein [Planctomycetota bacterium]
IEAELEANNSRPGPILKALLPLAHGSVRDRRFLAQLAEDLKVGNRELAEISFGLLEDPDPDLRYQAMAAFAKQATKGNLGEFVAEHKARFQALALTGTQDRPAVFAFMALSAVGDKETDEFILRQFEATASLPESWSRAAAMARVGPRILPAEEPRVVDALRRVLDRSCNDLGYVHWIELALQLTPQRSVEMLRFASTRIPENQDVLAEGLEGLVRCVEAGKTQDALEEIERLRREHGAVSQWAITGAARKIIAALK